MSEKSRVLGASAVALAAGLLAAKSAEAQHAPAYEDIGDRTHVTCQRDTVCSQVDATMHAVNVRGAPGERVCVSMEGPRRQDGAPFELYTWQGNKITANSRCDTQPSDRECVVTATPRFSGPAPAQGEREPERTQLYDVCMPVSGGAHSPSAVEVVGRRAVDENERRAPIGTDDPGQVLRVNVDNTGQPSREESGNDMPEPQENPGNGSNDNDGVDGSLSLGVTGYAPDDIDGASTGMNAMAEACFVPEGSPVAGCVGAQLEADFNNTEESRDASGRRVRDSIVVLLGRVAARIGHLFEKTTAYAEIGGGIGGNLSTAGEAVYLGDARVGVLTNVSGDVDVGAALRAGVMRRTREDLPSAPVRMDQDITFGGVEAVVNF